MSHIYLIDLVTLSAYLVAMVFLHYGWDSFLRPDARNLLLAFICIAIMHSLSNVLEWSGITSFFDNFEDYLEMLMPLFWGMFFYAFFQDLLARDLRESEKRYELATTSGNIAVWSWDVAKNNFFVDFNLGMMLGYSAHELSHKIEDWFSLVHAEDAIVLRRQQEELVSGKTSQIEQEIRMKTKEGKLLWFLVRGTTLKDQQRGEVRFFGTVIEITKRKEAQDEMLKALSEKEVLLKEVHHRVKNNLQIISSLFDLQFEKLRDAKTQEMILKTQERIKAIAFIHDMLYHARELTAIDFAEYIDKLSLSLFQLSPMKKKGIEIRNHIHHRELNINSTIVCGLIVNELVTNSLKHAFIEHRKGAAIDIYFDQEDDGRYCLTLKDNGLGTDKDLNDPQNQSLGLQLVSRFAEQLKAEFLFSCSEGVEFKMLFKPIVQYQEDNND